MKKGKLIVIEGTDCSGKETQTDLLFEALENDGLDIFRFSFPNYASPTGRIVGGPYLGKSYICDGWFPEEAPNVELEALKAENQELKKQLQAKVVALKNIESKVVAFKADPAPTGEKGTQTRKLTEYLK